jgi:hypothetical protein
MVYYGIDEQQMEDSNDFGDSSLASPDSFFRMWMTFFEDYRRGWKEEQKRIAREIFASMESKRRVRWFISCTHFDRVCFSGSLP